ncbi:MAG: rhomboid family intramembrane serine protease [Chitinispirillaceae bacterium]|jgi:membrane associated rhomboid family serine protease|nr:rhomboid family intramembrane serine protease [Chitinispirillaceae bacterium]
MIPLTPVVRGLLIANLAAVIIQMLFRPYVQDWGALVPQEVFIHGQAWRLVTYLFLHSTSSIFHLLFNMLALWMFGAELEDLFGSRKFLFFYFICGIGAGLFGVFYLLSPFSAFVPVIGASGAVLGLLTAYAIFFPNREVLLFFVLPVRVWLVVAGYAVISLLYAFQSGGGVAHLIHLGGIVVAFGYIRGRPFIGRRFSELRDRLREHEMRRRAVDEAGRKRFYAERIDPILAKISKSGMASLTKEEKKLLKQAGDYGKSRLKQEKIIPFDAFKK